MFCSNCGTEIPNEANFCWKCGKPQKPDVTQHAQVSDNRYELCEIKIVFYLKDGKFLGLPTQVRKYAFEAEVIGPKGKYSVGKSSDIYIVEGGETEWTESRGKALDSLINNLVEQGWQPLPQGKYWYSYRFQRPVK